MDGDRWTMGGGQWNWEVGGKIAVMALVQYSVVHGQLVTQQSHLSYLSGWGQDGRIPWGLLLV